MSPIDQEDNLTLPGAEERNEFLAMPFLEHLEELRRRLLRSAIGVCLTTSVAFYFSGHIMRWFLAPLGDTKLIVTEVTGSFMAYFKIGLIAGLIAALPLVFWQLWGFISPGLYKKERKMVLPFVIIATILFLGGSSFCYFLVLPFALKFMLSFSGGLLNPMITVSSYISFAGMLMLAFGLCFEMPVAAYILGRMGIISSKLLSKGRRVAIVIILVASAILTPTPDIINQLLLAGPMYILYEVSIIVVRLTGKRK